MNQSIQVITKPIHARLKIPSSNNITFQAIMIAALSSGVCELRDILINKQTRLLIDLLRGLGISIQLDESEKSCIIAGGSGFFPKKESHLFCQDNQTVVKFLLASCASSSGNYLFDAHIKSIDYSLLSFLEILGRQGATISSGSTNQFPFTLQGKQGLQGGEIKLHKVEDHQFVSALLMVAPFAKTQMTIEISDKTNLSDIDLTCGIMSDFGVLVRRLHQSRFLIPVPQRYATRDYEIAPDLTLASYFFAAAAITAGQVTIQPSNVKHSKQKGAKFISILEKMGCQVTDNLMGFTLKGAAELSGISVDMRSFSETFLLLAAVAPFAKKPVTMTNIYYPHELNLISIMREELMKLKVLVEAGKDWLKVYPSQPQGAVVDSHNEPHIAMALCLIGLRTPQVEIKNAECITEYFSSFYELWNSLYH